MSHLIPLQEKRAAVFAGLNTENVFDLMARHAALVDDALRDMAGKEAKDLCVLACGGYGRTRLAPGSDIDLLFLTADAPSPAARGTIENIQKNLWSLGVKPSCSARTPAQCEADMRTDIQFLTSLLDRRRVTGDAKLFALLDAACRRTVSDIPPSAFIAAKLAERDARHVRMGDTRYQLQPNVKEGKGALRDIQTIRWIADFLGLDLASLLDAQEAVMVKKASAFFWTVRCHLHLLGAGDRLSFETQPDIARLMGYDDRAPNRRAEKFMKDYFLMTNEAGHLTRALCAALESEALKGAQKMALVEEVEGFPVKHGRLALVPSPRTCGERVRGSAKIPQIVSGEPPLTPALSPQVRGEGEQADIIRLFRVSQTSGLDIHPDALRGLRETKSGLKRNPEGMKILLDILLDPKNAETTLRRMNEAGILSALIPEFESIVARMQYDMYHSYTADEHTLRAVGLLHAIENGGMSETAPLASLLFRTIGSRRALYAAMLLHDTAKGTGGKHDVKGAEIARKICPALGLSREETETAAWLVQNHLLMTMTAYKRDLSDPRTLDDFVSAVQSPERLKLLTILTVADIMAVGPGRWNAWKSGLLSALYHKTAETLAGAQTAGESAEQLVAAQRAARRLVGDRTETMDYLADHAPAWFWLSFSPEFVAGIVGMLHGKEEATVVRITPLPKEDYTEVVVHAPDRKGLFAALSGAMAAAGANIAEARIFTLGSSMALDVFHVQTPKGHVYENADFLKKTLKSALAGTLDFAGEIAARQKKMSAKPSPFAVEPRVIIDNAASAGSTVIEVNGKDRPGFLYDVTSALSAEGMQISAAKIATFGTRAVDVFYVKDVFGLKAFHHEKLARLEQSLLRAIS